MVPGIRTAFAIACCFSLCACPSAAPGDNGDVQPGTGGRSGNSIALYVREITLYYDDEELAPSQRIDILHEGARITIATASGEAMPAWLLVSPLVKSGEFNSNVTLTFQPLSDAPHTNRITLRFSSSDADGTHVVFEDVPLTSVVEHRLSRSREYLTYTQGAATPPRTSLEITADGNWEANPYPPWMPITAASFNGNGVIDIATTPAGLAAGDYIGVMPITHTLSRRTKVYRLYLGVEPRRLEVDKRGLAFSATRGAARLAREIHVSDTAGLAGRWRIDTDAPWLTANAAGGSGSATLTLSANPTGLADGLYYANVTLRPDAEPGFSNDATVRVGLHVDRSTPANTSVALAGNAPAGTLAAMDPIRPWLYAFDNDASDTTLRVWNVHTGALVASQVVPGVTVARARVFADGSKLLVADTVHRRFVPIALDNAPRVVAPVWTGMRFLDRVDDFTFARLNGADVIVWSAGQLLSAQNGAVLANFEYFPSFTPTAAPSIATAQDGRFGCMMIRQSTGSQLLYLALGNRAQTFSAAVAYSVPQTGGGHSCALDASGANVYAVTDAALYRYPFQALRFALASPITRGGRLQVLDDGDLYLSGGDGAWAHYDGSLSNLGGRPVAGEALFGLVSGDETRVLEIAGAQSPASFRDRDF